VRLAELAFLGISAASCGVDVPATAAGPPGGPPVPGAHVAVRTPGEPGPQGGPARGIGRGSRVVRVDGGRVTVLSEGLEAAGRPSARHDGARVLFTGREPGGGPLAVFDAAAAGGDLRAIVRHPTDVGSAAYLPDGRVVYSADLENPPPRGAPAARGAALFVAPGDGTAGRRITWGGLDVDPEVLSDGRVLFATWRAGTGGAGARFALATVHPDGTGPTLFHAGPFSLRRPRQLPSLDVECEEESGAAGPPARVVLSWDAPGAAGTRPAPEPPGARAGGERDPEAVSLAPRPRPQGHLSVVREDRTFGTLYCVDARRGAPGAARARLRALGPDGGTLRVLGETPLLADGSFHVRVPPDTPIAFDVLDAAGSVVAEERGPLWVRPNEVRGCVGCHDDAETGPPNVRPAAVGAAPADLTGAPGTSR
jgi:hypothetical protein